MAPPQFSTQGEAAGKARGRKKTKEVKSTPRGKAPAKNRGKSKRGVPKAKAKAKSSKAKPTRSAASSTPKAKAKAKAKSRAIPAPEEEPVMPSSPHPKSGRKRAASEGTAPSSSKPKVERKSKARTAVGDEPRVPPPHVTHNHIYSSAYRKALALESNDVQKSRKVAHEAVDFFKRTGTVNGLCGQFRSQPRKSRGATDAD